MNILIEYSHKDGLFTGEDMIYGIRGRGRTEEQCADAVESAVATFVLVAGSLGMEPLLVCPGKAGGNA